MFFTHPTYPSLSRLSPAILWLCAASALAQDWSVTSTATVASQYVSRGVRQSWGRPAAQFGIDAVHAQGWSAGTWISNVSSRYIEDARVEWDLYGGYSTSAGPVTLNATLYYYRYPGAVISATGTRFNYAELAVGASWRALAVKYNRTVTRDYFGITDARGTGYLDVAVNHDMGSGYTLNLHVGDGRVAGAGNAVWNWRDAKAGVTRTFDGGWSAAAAVTRARGATGIYDHYGTGVPDRAGVLHTSDPTKTTLVLSASRTF